MTILVTAATRTCDSSHLALVLALLRLPLVETGMARGVASACLAWLALTGVVYLVVFLTRRRAEHGWLAAQSLCGAAVPLWVLGLGELALLGAAVALACAASVRFTHAHFALPAPGPAWTLLPVLGVAAALLAPPTALAVVTLLIAGAAIARQIEMLVRLVPRFNARLLLGAWAVLGLALLVDVAAYRGLAATIAALTALAFLYTVALARHHGLSLEQAESHRRELETRIETIERKSKEIEELNQELRRQIGMRSRQLAGALASKATGLAIGSEIAGRYRVVGHLGTGGMGLVYEVVRATDQRRLALKLLHGHAKPAVVERFAREAEILARLDHPSLVGIVDIDVTADGQPFIVMELVDGVALERALETEHDLAWRVRVLTEVAGGLAAIHSAGIVHRDLKPANILIASAGGAVKIADFGVSAFERCVAEDERSTAFARTEVRPRGRLTATGVIVGTPGYMAPELLAGSRAATAAIDIFSFGVLAYELLAGKPPFDASVLRLTGEAPPPPLGELVPGLAPELLALIDDCLAWKPDARPSAEAVAARLRALPSLAAIPLPVARRADDHTAPTLACGSSSLPRVARPSEPGVAPPPALDGEAVSVPGRSADR